MQAKPVQKTIGGVTFESRVADLHDETSDPVAALPVGPNHSPLEPRPEEVEFGGVRYLDPFRWLEENADEVVDWQSAQDAIAQAHLAGLPAFGAFAKRLAAIGPIDDLKLPVHAGGKWFITHVPAGEDLSVVDVADTPTGVGRRVLDLNAMREGEAVQMQGFVPSPDGRKAVFIWAKGGHESGNLQVIDLETGKVLVDGVPQEQPIFPAWLPDGSGICYRAIDPNSSSGFGVYQLSLGEPAPTEAAPIELDNPVAVPVMAADGRHMLLWVDCLYPRPQYILDTQGEGIWRPFLKDMPGLFRGDILGDRYIAITDDGAPGGRLVSIPLATPTERETWKELVPASDNVLGTVVVTGGRAALLYLDDTYARLQVFGTEGDLEGEVALPGRGMVNASSSNNCSFNIIDCMARGEDGQVMLLFSTPTRSPALYSADLATCALKRWSEPEIDLDAQVLDFNCKSADGASLGYHVVARRDLDLSKPQPTVIFGYGGFNIAVLPGWPGSLWAAWIQAGGVLVVAHLRGGGEYGTTWWQQGRLELKQNSFNDVYAVAEDLFARGISSADKLGMTGASNGGLVAAAIVAQRPDLFRAVVPQVPVTDVLAIVRDPTSFWISKMDYGDPTDPAAAPGLYTWSPYQNIRDGVSYPAVMVDSGLNDPRCPPWHGRKFVARLQHASTSGLPVLLRVRTGAGHGTVGKADQDLQATEVLTFFAEELGLDA